MTEDSGIVTIHVRLLNEGFPTAKLTQARALGEGRYEILLLPDYDPEDEEWEFLPGDIVRCEPVEKGWMVPLFLAVEKVG